MLSDVAPAALLGPMVPQLEVDLDAMVRNYRRIRALAPGAEVWPVVKANGYGVGAAEVARALVGEGAGAFFVATAAEGVALKPIVGERPLYLLNGLPAGMAREVAAQGLSPVLNSRAQLREWLEIAPDRPCAVQVDTGINRTGMPHAEFEAVVRSGELGRLRLMLFMSHLACADEPAHPMNRQQLERFLVQARSVPGVARSLAASAGALLARDFHFDVLRPGIGLFGGNPMAEGKNPFEPVLRLVAPILQLREIEVGESVGYGRTFVAKRRTRIATVPVGYADGLPRALSNAGIAVIGDTRVAYAGRVSMDLVTLDVTDLPETATRPGTPVELLGKGWTIDDMAQAACTAPYEVLNRLGTRYARIYRREGRA